MAYTTADLNGIVTKLEAQLAKGTAEVQFEGRKLVYRSMDEILRAIAYFKALFDNATDAPQPATQKVRTYLAYPNKGFGG